MSTSRSTDPITSKIAGLQAESTRDGNENWVLESLKANGDQTSYELSEDTGIPYVTVSPLLRPLAREGKIHEVGTRTNPQSGASALLWSIGPSPNWKPGHSMPAVETGPQEKTQRKSAFLPFTCWEEIEYLWKCGGDKDNFIKELNAAIESRIR